MLDQKSVVETKNIAPTKWSVEKPCQLWAFPSWLRAEA